MPKHKMTFDQIVYSIVAIPALFFGCYIVAAMIGFFAFGFVAKRLRLEKLDQQLGISPMLGDGTAAMAIIALFLLIPAAMMTKRFFVAGWPQASDDRTSSESHEPNA